MSCLCAASWFHLVYGQDTPVRHTTGSRGIFHTQLSMTGYLVHSAAAVFCWPIRKPLPVLWTYQRTALWIFPPRHISRIRNGTLSVIQPFHSPLTPPPGVAVVCPISRSLFDPSVTLDDLDGVMSTSGHGLGHVRMWI